MADNDLGLLSLLGTETARKIFAEPTPPQMTVAERQRADRFIDSAVEREAQREHDAEHSAFCRYLIESCCGAELDEVGTKAPATRDIYLRELKDFVADCRSFGVSSVPADPAAIAAYILELVEGGASPARIRKVSAAIAYLHTIKNYVDPTDHLLIKAVVRLSRKKSPAKTGRKKSTNQKRKLNGKAAH